MAIAIQGSPSGNAMEVAANTLAARMSARPMNVGAFGSYSYGAASGVMAAGLAANSPIFTFRSAAAAGPICLVRRVLISAVTLGTAFAAGSALFQMFVCRSFTVNDTGGGAATVTTNNLKRRTSFASTAVQDLRTSATATLTAGTRTTDASALASLFGVCSATASTVIVPPTEIYRPYDNDWPLILAANEGFTIQATVAATGTWSFSVQVDWDECPSTEI
jgi:hypothetical protein